MHRAFRWISLGLEGVTRAKRRTLTAASKARVAKEVLREDKTVRQIAAKHAVHPNHVSQWKCKASGGLVTLFERGAKTGRDEREAEVRNLHEKIVQLAIERDFLKSAWDR